MFKRLIASLVCLTFIFSNFQYAHAKLASPEGGDFNINQLPVPGTMVGGSVPFTPLALKGLVVNPQKPLEFQFIVDTGNSDVVPGSSTVVPVPSAGGPSPEGQAGIHHQEQLKQQANQLVKYFLTGLTIPEGDLWVNLSPYEKNRMAPEALGQTDLGRDLLAQDYILKQLTASLIYPEKDLGKEFWSRVYQKAQEQFGTTNVPVNTFNKVWILPNQAQVFENGNAAYVTKSTLKVMLDEDYLALQKHASIHNDMASAGANIVRAIILPEIEKEVNTGKNFAPLRQIYQALILAKWYKETIQNGLLDAIYINKKKIAGVNLDDLAVKEQIYERYLQAYKKGAFNYIKEAPTPNGQAVPKKYFSGGITEIEPTRIDRGGSQAMISAKDWVAGTLLFVSVVLGVSVANTALAQSVNKWLQNSQFLKEVAGNNEDLKQLYLKEYFTREFIGVVESMLFNRDGEVNISVVNALGEFGDTRVIGPLRRILETNKDPKVRLSARNALNKLRKPRSKSSKPPKLQIPSKNMLRTVSKNPGGIDLNQINVNRAGKTVNVQFDQAQLNKLIQGGFEGFTPVITNITHISSPFQLLGINKAKEPETLVKA